MFRQDRTNPSTAVSNWKGRKDTPRAFPSTAVSKWLNGGLFAGGLECPSYTVGASHRAGYAGIGSSEPWTGRYARINRLAYSDETMACFYTSLVGTPTGGGFANSGTAGYMVAGYLDTGATTDVYKCVFSTDALSTLASGASVSRRSTNAAVSNNGTAGYLMGGYAASGTTYSDIIDKWAFSDDSRSTLSSTLSRGKYGAAGHSNSGVKGYAAGGYGTGYGSPTNQGYFQETTYVQYSGDSTGTISATIPLYSNMGTYEMQGAANSGTAGYTFGGYIGPLGITGQTRIMKLLYSTETLSTLSDTLSISRRRAGSYADSGTAAYSQSGNTSSNPNLTIDKLTFSTDAVTTIGAQLQLAQVSAACFSNTAGL
jgi:hypothetical protein